jgi:DNA-binding GntR family transcriptional regulator
MRFHRRLVALAGSNRIDELTVRLLAELRLVFHIVNAPRQLHEPYIARNRHIADLLAAGDPAGAADYLLDYLRTSEQQILAAYRDLE